MEPRCECAVMVSFLSSVDLGEAFTGLPQFLKRMVILAGMNERSGEVAPMLALEAMLVAMTVVSKQRDPSETIDITF